MFPALIFSILFSLPLYAENLLVHHSDRNMVQNSNTDSLPVFYTENTNDIPDYYQRDNDFGGFPQKGAVYCGPTAISNYLYWFAQNGYPRLLQTEKSPKSDQYHLISLLGSSRYINTGRNGSSPDNITKGIKRFLSDRGYRSANLKFYGWREIAPQFKAESSIPDLKTAYKFTFQQKAVWLNIGWYKYDPQNDEYTRTGGHWVTMTGYGHNGKKTDPGTIIIHDPETKWRINDYIKPELIKSGKLVGDVKNLPVEASGYTLFQTSFKRYGIIEGMLVLEMPPIKENIALQNS
jgi:hypothetical protein